MSRIREPAVMVPLALAALFGALFFYASIADKPSQSPPPFDPVRFMAAQESEVRDLMADPESVKFRKNTVAAEERVVCGEINIRNDTNAYVGFRRFISGPKIRKIEGAPASENGKAEYASSPNEMSRLWLSYCAHAK